MTTAADPTTAAERRVATRRQPAMGTVYRIDPPGDGPDLGLVWNISVTGLSMLLPAPRPSGSRLSGVLETMTDGHALPVAMRVVHVKLLETGDYFVGGHLDRPLTEAEIKPFVA